MQEIDSVGDYYNNTTAAFIQYALLQKYAFCVHNRYLNATIITDTSEPRVYLTLHVQ